MRVLVRANGESQRSDGIQFLSATFEDAPLEARYIKNTASNFREIRFSAVTAATVAAVVTNIFMTEVPSAASGGVWGGGALWANAPLNLSLSLFVLGLYALEPRKSTIRMQTLQRIAAGLLIVVTACLVYTACTTLRGGVGAGAARLQRALELNVGGVLFAVVSLALCETLAVSHAAMVRLFPSVCALHFCMCVALPTDIQCAVVWCSFSRCGGCRLQRSGV